MKKIITNVAHVVEINPDKFFGLIKQYLNDFQEKGFQVDIQYSMSGIQFSALIIGYTEVNGK